MMATVMRKTKPLCRHVKKCENVFSYTTGIIFVYEVDKAPCQNGEPHDLKDTKTFPEAFGVGVKRCSYCNETVIVDNEAHNKAVDEYCANHNVST
jgi:hypothetical protein